MSVLILMELVVREDGTEVLVQVDPEDHPDILVMPVDPDTGPILAEVTPEPEPVSE